MWWPPTEEGRSGSTWTPKVCRIIAFYRFRAIFLPTLGGLGWGPQHGILVMQVSSGGSMRARGMRLTPFWVLCSGFSVFGLIESGVIQDSRCGV